MTRIRPSRVVFTDHVGKLLTRVFTDYHVFLTTIRGLIIHILRLDSLSHGFLRIYGARVQVLHSLRDVVKELATHAVLDELAIVACDSDVWAESHGMRLAEVALRPLPLSTLLPSNMLAFVDLLVIEGLVLAGI